ncbi:MAG: methyl-accepting chemotaxis protein [bacterium]
MNFKDVTKLFNLLREKISLVRNFSHKDVLPLINELKRTIKGKIYLLSGALIVTLVAVSFICILTTIGSHEGMEAFYKDYSAIELKINDARCIEQKTINDLIVLIKLSKDNNKYLSKEIKNLNNQNLNVDTYFQNIKLDKYEKIKTSALSEIEMVLTEKESQIIDLVKQSEFDKAEAIYFKELVPLSSKKINLLDQINKHNIKKERFSFVFSNIIFHIFMPIVILLVIGAITAAFIYSTKLAERIVSPISKVNDHLNELSEGCFILPEEEEVNSEDETNVLTVSYRKTVMNLRELIGQFIESADEIGTCSENLTELADQSLQGAEQTAESTAQLAQGATEQAYNITQSFETVNKLNQTIENLYETSQSIVEMAKKMETLSGSGSNQSNIAVAAINKIESAVTVTTKNIQQLNDISTSIQKITGIIKAIATQTNLLALNASIEAARAGKFGKGFSVVAQEVKKLADQSSSASNEITDMIKSIQNHANSANLEMQESLSMVKEGVFVIKDIESILKEILDSSSTISLQFQFMSQEIKEVSTNSNSIVDQMDSNMAIVEEIAAQAEEISSICSEHMDGMQNVNENAQNLANMAIMLKLLQGSFMM